MKRYLFYISIMIICLYALSEFTLHDIKDSDIESKISNVVNSSITDAVNSDYYNYMYNLLGIDKNYDFSHDDFAHGNFKYIPHLVKIHIYPEKEGMSVAAWASDKFPPTTGHTDNNSEVTFPMISSARYNILIDDIRCSRYVYPVEDYYNISCEAVK